MEGIAKSNTYGKFQGALDGEVRGSNPLIPTISNLKNVACLNIEKK